MTRITRITTVCFISLTTLLIGWLVLHQGSKPVAPILPHLEELDRIIARVVFLEDSGEFSVPEEYVGDILKSLGQPSGPKTINLTADEIATLRLIRRDGREVIVRLFSQGKSPALYSVDGILTQRGGPYIGDMEFPLVGGSPRYSTESLTLGAALILMAKQPLDDRSRLEIRRMLNSLARSAGLP